MAIIKKRTRINKIIWRFRRNYVIYMIRFLFLPLSVILFIYLFIFILFVFSLFVFRILLLTVLFLFY